ncbi:MAG: YciI family protein, partial [Ilumatobacter sp.]|nr:YciI family protein [Ilumatobacter sp.]
LGGYYLVDVDSLERAQELAAQLPSAKYGRTEVRPLMELPG